MMTFDGEQDDMGGDTGMPASPAPEAPAEETPAAPEGDTGNWDNNEGENPA